MGNNEHDCCSILVREIKKGNNLFNLIKSMRFFTFIFHFLNWRLSEEEGYKW